MRVQRLHLGPSAAHDGGRGEEQRHLTGHHHDQEDDRPPPGSLHRAAPEPALRAHSPRDGRLVRRATSCGGLSTAATKIPSVSDDDRLAVDKVVPLDESEIANPLSWVTP